jgi:hypothetical protein
VVAILALIGKTFLESGNELGSSPALGLSKTVCGLTQFVRVSNLLAGGEREQMVKAWINPYCAMSSVRNALRLRVDEQAQIPARRPLNDTAAFDPALRKILSMETDMPYPWNVDARAFWGFEGIRKRDTRQLVALAFEPGFLGQFLVAALPRGIRRVQHALQGMTGDAELFAVIGQQVVKGFLAVIDAVFGILFYFPDSPIPDPGKLEQPGIQMLCLRGIETELQLSLDHATPVSGFQCTA